MYTSMQRGHKWDFPQVMTIAGQGKLYVCLQKPKALIGEEKTSKLSDLPSACMLSFPECAPDVQPLNECFAGGNMSADSMCDPQPSTSTGIDSSNTIKVGPSSISNRGTGSQSAAVNILTCNQMSHTSLMLEETTSLLMTQLMIFLELKPWKVGFVLEKVNVLI